MSPHEGTVMAKQTRWKDSLKKHPRISYKFHPFLSIRSGPYPEPKRTKVNAARICQNPRNHFKILGITSKP